MESARREGRRGKESGYINIVDDSTDACLLEVSIRTTLRIIYAVPPFLPIKKSERRRASEGERAKESERRRASEGERAKESEQRSAKESEGSKGEKRRGSGERRRTKESKGERSATFTPLIYCN
jgi:hypothetical protein